MAVSMVKGSKMLVFVADQIAYTLNSRSVVRPFRPRISRYEGERDWEWCRSMFALADCQI